MYMNKAVETRYELMHHGIKGQQWGVRNGPPYPLGSDVSTGKRLKNVGDAEKKKNLNAGLTEDNALEDKRAAYQKAETKSAKLETKMDKQNDKYYKLNEKAAKESLKAAKAARKGKDDKAIKFDQKAAKDNAKVAKLMTKLNKESKKAAAYKDTIDEIKMELIKEYGEETAEAIMAEWVKHGDLEMGVIIGDYLEHHGIKGQQWGVKNGPPYPLGSDVSTGKRLKNTGATNGSVSEKLRSANKKILSYQNERTKRKYATAREKLKIAERKAKIQEAKEATKAANARAKGKVDETHSVSDDMFQNALKSDRENIVDFVTKNADKLSNDQIKFAMDRITVLDKAQQTMANDPSKKSVQDKLNTAISLANTAINTAKTVKDLKSVFSKGPGATAEKYALTSEMKAFIKDLGLSDVSVSDIKEASDFYKTVADISRSMNTAQTFADRQRKKDN